MDVMHGPVHSIPGCMLDPKSKTDTHLVTSRKVTTRTSIT